MNEAEGSSPAGQTDSDPCFDFTHLDWSRKEQNSSNIRSQGPGWSGADIPIKNILHLHNWVAHTIHSQDSKALVSSGSWSSLASTWVGCKSTFWSTFIWPCLRWEAMTRFTSQGSIITRMNACIKLGVEIVEFWISLSFTFIPGMVKNLKYLPTIDTE